MLYQSTMSELGVAGMSLLIVGEPFVGQAVCDYLATQGANVVAVPDVDTAVLTIGQQFPPFRIIILNDASSSSADLLTWVNALLADTTKLRRASDNVIVKPKSRAFARYCGAVPSCGGSHLLPRPLLGVWCLV